MKNSKIKLLLATLSLLTTFNASAYGSGGGPMAVFVGTSNSSFDYRNEIDSDARKEAAVDAKTQVKAYIQSNSDLISIKCLSVKMSGTLDSESNPSLDVWRATATISLNCEPRNVADEAIMSFVKTCEKSPTPELLAKLTDPAFLKQVKDIDPTEFQLGD